MYYYKIREGNWDYIQYKWFAHDDKLLNDDELEVLVNEALRHAIRKIWNDIEERPDEYSSKWLPDKCDGFNSKYFEEYFQKLGFIYITPNTTIQVEE